MGFRKVIIIMDLVQMGYGYGHTDIRSFNFSLYAALELRSGTSGYLFAGSVYSVDMFSRQHGNRGQDSLIRSG